MQQAKVDNLVVIDIETAPCYPSFHDMNDSWQELWSEKVQRILPENVSDAEFYPMRAGVMAEFSKIVCISIGYFTKDNPRRFRVKSFCGEDERILLESFLQVIEKIRQVNDQFCFAGHNIKEFDVPFISRRLMILGLRIPAFMDFQSMKPWEVNLVDTFQYWRFGDFKNYTSLKLLAACMGLPSPKEDIDGSMVGPLFWEKDPVQRSVNLKRIAAYCEKDVVTTANIILKFRGDDVLTESQVDLIP